MKKLFFATAAAMLCLFISCNDAGTGTTGNDDEAKTKANFEIIHNALETGDVSKLDSLIDKDIVDHGNPMGDVKGIDSVKKWFVDFHNNTTGVKVTSLATAVNGDYCFDWNKMTGTLKNPMMGMPAGPFEWTTLDIVKLKDGKAVEHWSYMDPRDMMKMGGDHSKDTMAPQDSTKK